MGETLWTCVATCQVCGVELNRAEHVPEGMKGRVVMGAPLMAVCKTPGHSTFSDCNFAPKLEWSQEEAPRG